MSKIDDLVKQLCPDGVEMVKINEVYKRLKGTPITAGLMKEIEDEKGDTLIFAGGKTIVRTFESAIPKANIIREPSVIVQSRGVIDVQYCEEPCTFKNEMWAYTHENPRCTKYLLYYLKTKVEQLRRKGSEHGSMPQISLAATEELVIPLPPLPIQEEIVRILDKFTSLIDKIDEEITLRQKQYEYYREKLLTFEDEECVVFSSIISIERGKRLVREELKDDDSVPVYQNSLTPLGYYNHANRKAETPFVISAGAAGDVGFSEVAYWAADDCFTFSTEYDIVPKFLFHILKIKEFYLKSQIRGGAIKRLPKDVIEKLLIFIPSLDRQQEIVTILDKFESVIQKLKEVRDLRQKQYEYYREKLLTF